ncbi:MAG: DUF5652 family protein [Nanoarchaeota archaeon]
MVGAIVGQNITNNLMGLALFGGFSFFLILLVIWELIWKGMALWHSARNKQKEWFIALLILNTVGILPIIYLIWFKKKKK